MQYMYMQELNMLLIAKKIKPNVVTDCVGKYALSYDFKHFDKFTYM